VYVHFGVILPLLNHSYRIQKDSSHPTGVEIVIKLTNPMARGWAILSNRPILFFIHSRIDDFSVFYF